MAFQQRVTANIAGQTFWRIAIVAAAGAIGSVSRADAAYYYWQDSDPTYYRPVPAMQPRRPVERRQVKKNVVAPKETGAKPQGALIIAVSINKQQVKLYDANGFFAEAPVSTGMKGHGTPMGVFSVIQKHKWHHSNIYSGAPMPYMQRITWSGVALHAGVLPGYPASHGCIRMPEAFAIKMWNWTRMGARVLVTPGEISPTSFTHPLLPSIKVQPQPQVSADAATDAPLATKADKGAADKPDVVETRLELRAAVDHNEAPSPDADATRDKTRTADASSKAQATMSDAGSAAPRGDVTVDLAATKQPTADNATPKTEDVATATPKVDMRASDAKSAVKPAEPAKAGDAAAQKPAAKADAAPDARKDDTRLPDAAKAAAAKTEAAKRAGQIAVFISRKDSKLYVRQNLAPLFDSPVTIAPSDRPLGTHVFTAEIDRNDPNVVHWSVVSLPVSTRGLVHEDEPRSAMRRKGVKPEPVAARATPAIDSPTEALNRITIPADVMARITDALTTGGSIIVSDQGINQGETGEGTDFIVSLR
ncbi:L,D-transpeptidase [Bradyrhizobium sp. Tv2a-2]|uniref:L,D-transpeptidase n=1 Tax=Bradyrhizobium sp. Tv2a-2 TaxID=113395 RepID=UPI000407CE8A|nr:L,D-transpeptidase [Bradyrhizobium sp. Tv2a-2]